MKIELSRDEAETLVAALNGLEPWLDEDKREYDRKLSENIKDLRPRLIKEFDLTEYEEPSPSSQHSKI